MISSYSSIYNLGHAAVAELLHGDVIIEEKIDGSQISFGIFPTHGGEVKNSSQDPPYELQVRSKGAMVNTIAPEGMFSKAVTFLQSIADKLVPGYIYRGEYLSKPKHNCLCYSRIPNGHIAIFDIEEGEQKFLSPLNKAEAARRINLEPVPVLYQGLGSEITPERLRELLETESVLGGQKIEGFVIKPANYDLFGRDKKVLMGKFVSEAFKEVHSNEWKKEHGTKSPADIIGILASNYGTPARWSKAVLHLREHNEIENSPRDIGKLMAEVPTDIEKECVEELKDQLFKWAWPQIRRAVTRGLPQWYKDELLKRQFDPERKSIEQKVVDGDIPPWDPYANMQRSINAYKNEGGANVD